MNKKPQKCVNAPTCPNMVKSKGYCDSCKALRVLLSRLHGDDDHEQSGGRWTDDEELRKRLEIHRKRAGW